jgi:hypothetical protein
MDSLAPSGTQRPVGLCRPLDVNLLTNMASLTENTDGEVVIMLAFQASGTGSIPVRCIIFLDRYSIISATRSRAPFNLVFLCVHHCLSHCPFRHL